MHGSVGRRDINAIIAHITYLVNFVLKTSSSVVLPVVAIKIDEGKSVNSPRNPSHRVQ